MVKRKKIWYSKNEVETGLYTPGNELMTTDFNNYTGYYHKYLTTKEIFTESEFNNKSIPLIPNQKYITSKNVKEYKNIEGGIINYGSSDYVRHTKIYNPSNHSIPYSHYPNPSQEDFKNGYINRYFVKRRNDKTNIITEINEESYNTYGKKQGIDKNLYQVYVLKWKLTGKLKDELDKYNIIIKSGIYDTNKRLVNEADKHFRGINKYLTNYIEFSRITL
jgi:hypothetical protein